MEGDAWLTLGPQITFLTEWQLYAQKVEGDAWKGQKLDPVVMEKMTGELRVLESAAGLLRLGRGKREVALLTASCVQRSRSSSSTSCCRRYGIRRRAARAGHRDRLEPWVRVEDVGEGVQYWLAKGDGS